MAWGHAVDIVSMCFDSLQTYYQINIFNQLGSRRNRVFGGFACRFHPNNVHRIGGEQKDPRPPPPPPCMGACAHNHTKFDCTALEVSPEASCCLTPCGLRNKTWRAHLCVQEHHGVVQQVRCLGCSALLPLPLLQRLAQLARLLSHLRRARPPAGSAMCAVPGSPCRDCNLERRHGRDVTGGIVSFSCGHDLTQAMICATLGRPSKQRRLSICPVRPCSKDVSRADPPGIQACPHPVDLRDLHTRALPATPGAPCCRGAPDPPAAWPSTTCCPLRGGTCNRITSIGTPADWAGSGELPLSRPSIPPPGNGQP